MHTAKRYARQCRSKEMEKKGGGDKLTSSASASAQPPRVLTRLASPVTPLILRLRGDFPGSLHYPCSSHTPCGARGTGNSAHPLVSHKVPQFQGAQMSTTRRELTAMWMDCLSDWYYTMTRRTKSVRKSQVVADDGNVIAEEYPKQLQVSLEGRRHGSCQCGEKLITYHYHHPMHVDRKPSSLECHMTVQ